MAAICTTVFLLYLNMESVAVINIKPDLNDPQRVLIWASMEVVPKLVGTLLLSGIMAAGLSSASTFLSVIGFSVSSDIIAKLIWASMEVVPKLVGTLLLSGIMAAGLSSASTFLSVIGFSVSSDIIAKEFRSTKEELRFNRMVMLAVGVLALILAYLGLGSMRVIAYFASTIIAASWAVPAIGSVFCKRLSATGARYAMLAGFFGFIFSKCLTGFHIGPFDELLKNFLDPFFIGIYLSILFAVIGSKRSPKSLQEESYHKNLLIVPHDELLKNFLDPFFIGIYLSILFAVIGSKRSPKSLQEESYHKNLLIVPQNERVRADYRRDRIYGYLMIIAGIATACLLLFGWAFPYNGIL